ncbi:MAG TPA: MoxR family ATPase [Terriglobia bacterium]|nr:MoxR family ATPase [Terriglobia bacterium]
MLKRQRYVLDHEAIALVYLALAMEKPLLIEGPPGAGKTEIAKVLAEGLEMPLIRLQCYEGVDESKALYQWNEPLQRMALEFLRRTLDGESTEPWRELKTRLYSPDFLVPGPILQALQSEQSAVLLVDEVDKTDAAFEAFLLEVLSDFQVSIPPMGTVKPKHRPVVVLTSNAQRKLTDALRGRCFLLWADYPAPDREAAILALRAANGAWASRDDRVQPALVSRASGFTQALRHLGMAKPPAIRESLDWMHALELLGARELDHDSVSLTLPVLLKVKGDIDRARGNLPLLLKRASAAHENPRSESTPAIR